MSSDGGRSLGQLALPGGREFEFSCPAAEVGSYRPGIRSGRQGRARRQPSSRSPGRARCRASHASAGRGRSRGRRQPDRLHDRLYPVGPDLREFRQHDQHLHLPGDGKGPAGHGQQPGRDHDAAGLFRARGLRRIRIIEHRSDPPDEHERRLHGRSPHLAEHRGRRPGPSLHQRGGHRRPRLAPEQRLRLSHLRILSRPDQAGQLDGDHGP